MILEPPLYPGEPTRIIEEALKTLGLAYSDLALLFEADSTWVQKRLSSENMTVTEWLGICDALYLNLSCILHGYSRREHCFRIKTALRDGYFRLPKTWELRKLQLEFIRDSWKDFRYQGKLYRFRLRWKIRWQEFCNGMVCRILRPQKDYDPLERGRRTFQSASATNDFKPDLNSTSGTTRKVLRLLKELRNFNL